MTSRITEQDKPVLVFFFDEAHLLFDNAPRVLLERVEQVVRLIRFKVTIHADKVPTF